MRAARPPSAARSAETPSAQMSHDLSVSPSARCCRLPPGVVAFRQVLSPSASNRDNKARAIRYLSVLTAC